MREKNLSVLLLYAVSMVFLFKNGVHAAILSATVSVEGMACPFCAYGVEKKLKSVAGVESIHINMKEGTALLSARDGESIDIMGIPSAIKEAGFTPGTLHLAAVGRVETDERQRLFLIFNRAEQRLLLTDATDKMKEKLLSYEKTEVPVEIQGIARERSDGKWMLSPQMVKEVSE